MEDIEKSKKNFNSSGPDAEIDIAIFIELLWSNKYKIFGTGFIASILAVFFALSLPNIYQSEAILSPVDNDKNSLSNSMQNLGGIASLAGISVGSGTSSRTNEALATMQSFSFFEELTRNNPDLVALLMASNGWDKATDQVTYDSDILDLTSQKWADNTPPTLQETYRVFASKYAVNLDTKTGMVKVIFEHYSPNVAKDIVNQVTSLINSRTKIKDVTKAEKSIKYLDDQINTTLISEVKAVVSDLIQNQIQTVMLAESTDEYLFSIIEPPIASELKIKPKRSIIVISAGIGISFIMFFFVLMSNKELLIRQKI
jgi:uncharacterized protein involved in exopolysaccharide biosynthesis